MQTSACGFSELFWGEGGSTSTQQWTCCAPPVETLAKPPAQGCLFSHLLGAALAKGWDSGGQHDGNVAMDLTSQSSTPAWAEDKLGDERHLSNEGRAAERERAQLCRCLQGELSNRQGAPQCGN